MKKLLLLLSLPFALSACVTTGMQPSQNAGYQPNGGYSYQQQPAYQVNNVVYGKVVGLREVQMPTQQGVSNNQIIGGIGGAAVGALLGHQVGKGTGKTLATIGGAAAGAWAGSEAGKAYGGGNQPQYVQVYEIEVQNSSNGQVFKVNQVRELGYFNRGDHVRVEFDSQGNGKVTRN